MSTSVKHISSTQRGAPTLNGTAGTLIAVLDALFVSGWGPTTALSVSVSGGIATAQLNSGETFDPHAVILVDGATPSALSGESRVLTSSLTSITWATTAADGVATGTITIKYAPQTSWSKPYAATNVAVYKSTHVQSNGHCLRIDDTGTTSAKVIGYESMSDVGTGVNPFPQQASTFGGSAINKSASANSTSVRYTIFCDERLVIFAIAPGTGQSVNYVSAYPRYFGDVIPMATSGDAWGTVLSWSTPSPSAGYYDYGSASGNRASETSGGNAFARGATGVGSSALAEHRPFVGGISPTSSVSGDDLWLGIGPSSVDGAVYTSKVFLREKTAGSPPRAIVPGVLYVPQDMPIDLFPDGHILVGSGDMAGRNLMVKSAGSGGIQSGSNGAFYLVDITGPWR